MYFIPNISLPYPGSRHFGPRTAGPKEYQEYQEYQAYQEYQEYQEYQDYQEYREYREYQEYQEDQKDQESAWTLTFTFAIFYTFRGRTSQHNFGYDQFREILR